MAQDFRIIIQMLPSPQNQNFKFLWPWVGSFLRFRGGPFSLKIVLLIKVVCFAFRHCFEDPSLEEIGVIGVHL